MINASTVKIAKKTIWVINGSTGKFAKKTCQSINGSTVVFSEKIFRMINGSTVNKTIPTISGSTVNKTIPRINGSTWFFLGRLSNENEITRTLNTEVAPPPPKKKKAKSWQLKISIKFICHNKSRPFVVKSRFEINLMIKLKYLLRNKKKVDSLPNSPILFSLPAPPNNPNFDGFWNMYFLLFFLHSDLTKVRSLLNKCVFCAF